MTEDTNRTRARRQMTDEQICDMGRLYATGNWTQNELGVLFGVGPLVVGRSLKYYRAHLKPADTTKEH